MTLRRGAYAGCNTSWDGTFSATLHLCTRRVIHAQHSEERKLVWAGSHQLQGMSNHGNFLFNKPLSARKATVGLPQPRLTGVRCCL